MPAIQTAYSLPVFLVLSGENVFASRAGSTVLVESDRHQTLLAVTTCPVCKSGRRRGWTRGWRTAGRALAGHDGSSCFTVGTN